MKTLICDTNIFIDLIQAQALDPLWAFSQEVYTTDLVMAEILVPEQRDQLSAAQRAGRLTVLELSGEEIAQIVQFPTQRNLKRITDKSVLFKALELHCCLLTGDGPLRQEAEAQGIEVHGSIWVISQIHQRGLASTSELLNMVNILSQNPRLPQKELQKLRDEISHPPT